VPCVCGDIVPADAPAAPSVVCASASPAAAFLRRSAMDSPNALEANKNENDGEQLLHHLPNPSPTRAAVNPRSGTIVSGSIQIAPRKGAVVKEPRPKRCWGCPMVSLDCRVGTFVPPAMTTREENLTRNDIKSEIA